ncbi:MAG: TolC family protein [Chitinophagia bacterium]|jgi:outer membrane protein|nr:TolC family protein [Chitinophagia bacterium]
MKSKLLIIFLFFTIASKSQDSSLSLKQAIDIALQQNLEIQISQTELEIAQTNNNWGNAGALPTVIANVSNTEAKSNINQKLSNGNSIVRNNVSNNALNSNLGISWRVYNGMRIRSTKERFETLEKIGTLAVQQQIDQVVFDVMNTYYSLVRLNKQLEATKAIINLSIERLKIAETRFNVGSGAKTDMLQASIDLNAQKVNLENLMNQVADARSAMNILLKRPSDNPFHPIDQQFSIPNITLSSLIGKLDTQNIQLLIAQQEKINLANDRKIINAQRLPSLTINTNTVLNRTKSTAGLFLVNQNFGPNIGLGLGIPIFNGNINKTQLKVNTIQQKRQNLQTELLRAELERNLHVAYNDFQNAVTVSKIEEQNLKLAEENNFISTERFKKLQSNSIELRQAQLSLIEAQNRYIFAQFNAQLAATALKFITGEISKNF